jgi:AcrR family transcriptional regulator
LAPRTAAQFEAIRDVSRERLLDSSLTLFAQHGYANTSIRMIAREAGVSQGLLYNYFQGKEELLHAIFARGMRDVQESIACAGTGDTSRQQLENLLRSSLEIVQRDQRFWKLSYGLRFQSEVVEGLGLAVMEWTEAIYIELERLLRAHGAAHPAIEARVLFALIDGITQHYVLDPDHYPLEEVVSAVLSRFLQAPE